jgi:hypothetical protein
MWLCSLYSGLRVSLSKEEHLCMQVIKALAIHSFLFHSSVRHLITLYRGRTTLLCLFCMTREERGVSPCSYTFPQRFHVKCAACFMKSTCISLLENIFWNVSSFFFQFPGRAVHMKRGGPAATLPLTAPSSYNILTLYGTQKTDIAFVSSVK